MLDAGQLGQGIAHRDARLEHRHPRVGQSLLDLLDDTLLAVRIDRLDPRDAEDAANLAELRSQALNHSDPLLHRANLGHDAHHLIRVDVVARVDHQGAPEQRKEYGNYLSFGYTCEHLVEELVVVVHTLCQPPPMSEERAGAHSSDAAIPVKNAGYDVG